MNVDKVVFSHTPRLQHVGLPSNQSIVEWVDRIKSYKWYPTPEVTAQRKAWLAYKKEVQRLTEDIAHQVDGIELRSFKGYHIDHKVSIYDGFKNSIPAARIADLTNLRIISSKDNMIKGRRSLITTQTE